MVKTFAISQLTWLILKGLLLIAQINFQRAIGVQNTKKSYQNSPCSASRPRDKKPESRITSPNSASQFESRRRELYQNRATCQQAFFCQSLPPLRGRLLTDYQSPPCVQEIF